MTEVLLVVLVGVNVAQAVWLRRLVKYQTKRKWGR